MVPLPPKLKFEDVLIVPQPSSVNSRSEVNLQVEYDFLHSPLKWRGVPIVASNMDTVGTFSMAWGLAKYGMLTCIHKYNSYARWSQIPESDDYNWRNHVTVTSGISKNDLHRLDDIISLQPDLKFICLDVANGYTQAFIEAVKSVRANYPEKIIIAGNVVTQEGTARLLNAGADIIKIGIGSGSVCITRDKTGVGYPQLSAVIECGQIADEMGGRIMSDGGCRLPGDVAKAFGAGADFVMLGSMLAGHKEGEGKPIMIAGETYYEFYGMSSKTAMQKYAGGVADYRTAEGKSIQIADKGNLDDTLLDILGGLRSTCTYVDANSLADLAPRTTFVQIN